MIRMLQVDEAGRIRGVCHTAQTDHVQLQHGALGSTRLYVLEHGLGTVHDGCLSVVDGEAGAATLTLNEHNSPLIKLPVLDHVTPLVGRTVHRVHPDAVAGSIDLIDTLGGFILITHAEVARMTQQRARMLGLTPAALLAQNEPVSRT